LIGRAASVALAALALIAAAPPQTPAPQSPTWEAAPVKADAETVAASIYVVKRGDTLSAIVAKTGAGADAIAQANDLAPPYPVRVGQKLKIPAGRYHQVRAGQSGMAIARAYGVDWPRIAAINHLEPPFTLRAGQRLLLPSESTGKMTLEQRAAAFKLDLDDLIKDDKPAQAETASVPAQPEAASDTASSSRFRWPLTGRVTRPFGPMANGGRSDGIIIAVKRGTSIRAAADGVVVWVGTYPAFGHVLLLRHSGGWVTIYGNADKLIVKRGQKVKRGQSIGHAGSSGSAKEPQLYFEVLEGRKPVDPIGVLPARR
jgi:murein DD-endopeptidase MepM/ murein hydrolase activator NlpD